jgi:hypothetical protein
LAFDALMTMENIMQLSRAERAERDLRHHEIIADEYERALFRRVCEKGVVGMFVVAAA